MAVSKRLRHEVMRRDNFACRYCGGVAPDVKLTIDHVTPTTLGGTDDPSNLVTACADCNSGKSATPPDAPLVADVEQDALRWAKAKEMAAEVMEAERDRLMQYFDAFDKVWSPRYAPSGHTNSLESLFRAGLPLEEMREAAYIAVLARGVDNRFAYFMGVAYKKLRRLEEIARGFIETGDA